MKRLSKSSTLHIDPTQEIGFRYGKKNLRGFAGDSVATALFRNDIRIFSRSFKYHRPRGLYSLDRESSTCLMNINGMPNVNTEVTLLQEGMIVEPQNVFGSPEHDLLSIIEKFDWALTPGFYYRFFYKPYKLWPIFQKRLRKMAGLGKISFNRKDAVFDHRFINTDLCVVGGGAAGMTAALTAAHYGLRVVLMESRPWLGGFYDWSVSPSHNGKPLYEQARYLIKSLNDYPKLEILTDSTLIYFEGDNLLTAIQKGKETDIFYERLVQIRSQSVIIATGSLERPLLFENNDRPGVMQSGCAHRLARTYDLMPGTKSVFSIGHDIMLTTLLDLSDLGLDIDAVADCRHEGYDEHLAGELENRGICFLPGWVAAEAHGKRCIKGVTLKEIKGSNKKYFDCDLLVASAGLSPNFAALALAGAKPVFDKKSGYFLARNLPKKLHMAGRLTGLDESGSIETSGRLAGLKAAADCGISCGKIKNKTREELKKMIAHKAPYTFIRAPGSGKKSFVCFDEDVTVKDIFWAADEGFDSIELSKRYTTAGMGPSQSGIPGINLPFVLAEYHNQEPGSIVPTNLRPPLAGTLAGTLAGRGYHLFKRTPLHSSQKALGGRFDMIGPWKRVRGFSKQDKTLEEIENVHRNVGSIDVSTLGKFKIWGPDAVNILQRIYVNDMKTIYTDKLKYIVAVNEVGAIIDDGVIVKTNENEYYFTTSSARAAFTIEWFRFHSRFEEWDFHIVDLTDTFGAINLTGPHARLVLEKLVNTDISNQTFPYMGYREINIGAGISTRAMRLGFCGELGFELHVPSSLTPELWDLLMEAGADFGIRPFGLEAMNTLRLEKGHIIIGVDTEQVVNLNDLGLGFLWARGKKGFGTVGIPSLLQTENQPGRSKLIGFRMDSDREQPKDGAVIVENGVKGRVSSCRYSAVLDETIGLALVVEPLAQIGYELKIYETGMAMSERKTAHVVPTPFYDPKGERLRI